MPVHRAEIETADHLTDALATQTVERFRAWLDLHPTRVRTRRVYHLDLDIDAEEAARVVEALVDPVAEIGTLGTLDDEGEPTLITVGFLPGVTDCVGTSVKRAAQDCLGRTLRGHVYTSTMYRVWGLDPPAVERAALELLANPVIERVTFEHIPRTVDLTIPRAGEQRQAAVESVPLRDASEDELDQISRDGVLALSRVEMRAIQDHFRARGREPTDAELECLAQTWSEHCKHKIFAAPIDYVTADGTTEAIEEGLFRRFIRGATEAVARTRKSAELDRTRAPFLVSVFHDNAGVVRFTETDHLVYKVETHNSPSALDPYGGAMTGIVGVNRDSFGTGRGADLLTNVWGYCFGDPRHGGRLPKGLMHPRRIRDGVHRGVIDGGNQSGIPYSRGFELFDARYLGKPLVFCGTVARMPVQSAGTPTHLKPVAAGDKVVMVGGRIGKDGIHGATFSSTALDEHAPVQAVQIGDPITQKMMFDMLAEARDAGLLSGMTDNGAGGLSSSVGEMAELTGGARIDLALAPLKYPGLAPWEILISEAQERMTLAVPPGRVDAFLDLCTRREVEATVLGEFTQTGRFECHHGDLQVVDLSLEFLHEGLPRHRLRARLDPPRSAADAVPAIDLGATLVAMLARPNLATPADRARAYDHEVKGLSVVKPLIGVERDVVSTATVMRVRHGRPEGVVLGEGIHPYFSDHDARAMAHACVDEAVRRVLCAGARIDRLAALDNFCWPDPVRSERTPDGEHKLAQLVQTCRGLREACEAYGLPLISGKDSMKNDAVLDGVKISIPPTLLVSVMGQMTDVDRALTLQPRSAGEDLYVLGGTRDELAGSELGRLLDLDLAHVPRTDVVRFAQRYAAFVRARDAQLLRSAHVVSRGGLVVALAHLALSCDLHLDIELDGLSDELSDAQALFSESTGRIVFTSTKENRAALATALGPDELCRIGAITARSGGGITARRGARSLFALEASALRDRFAGGLRGL